MRALACALVLALGACGGSKTTPDAGELPLDLLGGRVIDAVCACLLAGNGGAPYCSLSDCEAAYPQLGLATLAAELDAGLLAYDGRAAARCLLDGGPFCFPGGGLSGLVAARPSVEAIVGSGCSGVLTATRGAGESCLGDLDCDAGVCSRDGGACVGACAPPLPAGAACAVGGVPCAGALACLGGRCATSPRVGDPCRTLGSAGECGKRLWCSLDAGGCESWASPGASCQWRGGALAPPCSSPAWCDQWASVGICRPPSDAGGPCLTLDDSNDCLPELTCLPSDGGVGFGRCGAPIADGSACAGFGCADGHVCLQGRCTPGLPSGASCAGGCAAPLACGSYLDAGSFCGGPVCLGQRCAVDGGACLGGLCLEGSCVAPGLGQPCRLDSDCASGLCRDGGCADPYACVP